MTVTLHLPAAPAARSAMVRRVRTLATDPGEVRSGHGGLVVSDDLALAYLADGQPTAGDGHISHPMPPNLGGVVRNAEGRAGLLEPAADPAPDPQPRPRVAARRPRRTAQQQQGAPQ